MIDLFWGATWGIVWGVAVGLAIYSIPYLIRKGWNDAGKSVKVCDVCWREVKKVNKALDEYEKSHKVKRL